MSKKVNYKGVTQVSYGLSAKKVSAEIQQTMEDVEQYMARINSMQLPRVNNGKTVIRQLISKLGVATNGGVEEAMGAFFNYVQEVFTMIAKTQKLQNENDMNICHLMGVLAMLQADSYEKIANLSSEIKVLSVEDEKTIEQLKEHEKSFKQFLNDSDIDDREKKEQMSRLVDYITLITDCKTKKLRTILLDLSKVKTKVDKYIAEQDDRIVEIKTTISSWQNEACNCLNEAFNQLGREIHDLSSEKEIKLDDSLGKMKSGLKDWVEELEASLMKKMETESHQVDVSVKKIDGKILEYNAVIENQANTILSQIVLVKNQNKKIKSLQKSVYATLVVAAIAATSVIGIVAYMIIK